MPQEKSTFFGELDDLDRLSNEEQDCDDIALILRSAGNTDVTNPSTGRTILVPQSQFDLEKKEAPYTKSSKTANNKGSIQNKPSPGNPSEAKSRRTVPKKRRAGSIQEVPESQQIFRG